MNWPAPFGGTTRYAQRSYCRLRARDARTGETFDASAVLGHRWVAPAPRLVLHPLGEPAGGFTQVAQRACTEMGRAAGARQITRWQGPPLTDAQRISGRYPVTGKLLSS